MLDAGTRFSTSDGCRLNTLSAHTWPLEPPSRPPSGGNGGRRGWQPRYYLVSCAVHSTICDITSEWKNVGLVNRKMQAWPRGKIAFGCSLILPRCFSLLVTYCRLVGPEQRAQCGQPCQRALSGIAGAALRPLRSCRSEPAVALGINVSRLTVDLAATALRSFTALRWLLPLPPLCRGVASGHAHE